MKLLSHYTHFAVAYGTCILVPHALAVILQTNIRLGELGYYGFPTIGIVYAIFRAAYQRQEQSALDELKQQVARIEAEQLNQTFRLSDIASHMRNQINSEADNGSSL